MRGRATRFALDLVEGPETLSVNAACKRVGGQLGIVPDTLRNWVKRVRIDTGAEPGLTADERALLRELERENGELRQRDPEERVGSRLHDRTPAPPRATR